MAQQRERYLPNTFPPGLSLSPTLTFDHLQHFVERHPPTLKEFEEPKIDGLFAGPTSIAYLFFLLSRRDSGYADRQISGKVPSQWCADYLSIAPKAADAVRVREGEKMHQLDGFAPPSPWNCGIINHFLSWNAVMAVFTQESKHVKALLDFLPEILREDGLDEVDEDLPEGGNHEWLYGRPGYLYLLRLVRTYTSEAVIPHEVTDKVIQRILPDGPGSQRKWMFLNRSYLGAGHGWLGTVTQILLTDPSYKETLLPIVQRLVKAQLPSGNWPKYIMDDPDIPPLELDERFLQIGHGAPGVVLSLIALRDRVYTSEGDAPVRVQINNAIARAQDVIWEKGLLTKEPCLQHGAAGNALALTDLGRAATFLSRSTQEVVDRGIEDGTLEPSSSSALHRGLAGRIWAFWMFEKGDWGKLVTYSDV